MASSSTTSSSPVPAPPAAGGSAGAGTTDESTLQRGAEAVGEHAGTAVDAAKGEAAQVVRSATEHARTLLDSAGSELRTQGEAQAGRMAASLSTMSGELQHFADDPETTSPLTDVARTLSDATGRVARRLDEGGTDAVVQDVARYGRTHPVKFVAMAAAAGFVVGRILRSSDTGALRQSISEGAGSASDSEASDDQTRSSGVGEAGPSGASPPIESAVAAGTARTALVADAPESSPSPGGVLP